MLSGLHDNEYVLVNKIAYLFHAPERGDVIVFHFPLDTSKDFIKRVIGLPGEVVEMHRCVVYINGQPLSEPYLKGLTFNNCEYGPTTIKPDSLFVMGDNRDDSNDSRFQLGLIPYDKVIGRAFITIWPPSRIHLLHGL